MEPKRRLAENARIVFLRFALVSMRPFPHRVTLRWIRKHVPAPSHRGRVPVVVVPKRLEPLYGFPVVENLTVRPVYPCLGHQFY